MPNRIIKESICRSDSIDSLSWFEEVLFYRLIVVCDDFGRFDGRAAIIKGACFPLKDIRVEQIEKALDKLSTVGMVWRYSVEDRLFLQLIAWERHQQKRAKNSKYPAPDEECNHMISSDIKCHRESRIENRESRNENRETNACAREHLKRFEEFWEIYPSKMQRAKAEKAYCDVILNGIYSEDTLVECAKNYADYCKITGTDKIFHACNFLSTVAFEDYLPGRYKRPEKKRQSPKNAFCNFEQHDYDFDAIERDILANATERERNEQI